jgi:FKBP-type peptidyl-prolyl cis-trans isomerase (trigger factor)
MHIHLIVIISSTAAFLLAGCGHQATSPIHEEVDFSESTDIFTGQMRAPRTEVDPNGLVATVNGKTINHAQLQRALNEKVAQLQSRYSNEQIQSMVQRLANDALNDLIRRILLLGEVESEQITVPDEQIDETIAEAKANLESQGGSWQEFLTQSKISEEDVREETKQQLRIKELLGKHVAEPGEPTEEQILEFFESQRENFRTPDSIVYRHILVRVESDADKSAWEVAEERVEELRSLAAESFDFEELARKFSDDETTRDK